MLLYDIPQFFTNYESRILVQFFVAVVENVQKRQMFIKMSPWNEE